MDIVRPSIRQPVTVFVGVLLVILAGVLSLSRLPIALTPNVETLVITVTTGWEGASPEEIEQNVIDRQEERLFGVSNLVLMTSSSMQSAGTIRLQFATGTGKDEALREVIQRLNEVAQYPDGVDEPVVVDGDPENRDYIAWILLGTTDETFDVRTLRDFALDRIQPALERVPGIAQINVLGGREREVQLHVDPVRLAQHGVTPSRLASVIRDTNRNVSAGQVADGKRDVRLRTIGQFRNLDEVGRTVIGRREGGEVRIADVAEIVETYKEPTGFVRSRGKPVIAINAERELGSNVMTVMKDLRRAIELLNARGGLCDGEARRLGLDGTIYLEQAYDQTVYIQQALALVRQNIWIGGALATIVLIVFLRSIRGVGIIALAIPISIVGAVTVMVALGRSINVISLAGMAFAVGMVVDNAIVVLENIHRHLEMGKTPMDAAADGAREVWGAVFASTLTTIAVFVPILMIQEEAGQLFRDIAIAICAAVGLSLIVSMTLIPTMAARVLRKRKTIEDKKKEKRRASPADWLSRFTYAACGSWLARFAIIIVLTGVSVVGTLKLKPEADYLPQGNRNLVFGMIIPPPGYNVDQFESLAKRIESTVQPYWEAGEHYGDPDAYAGALDRLPEVIGRRGPLVPPSLENYFLVKFDDILFHGGVANDDERTVDMLPLFMHATRADQVPGSFAFPFQVPLFQLGGSTGSAIKLQLAGTDLDEITTCSESLLFQLISRFGPYAVQPDPSNFNLRTPEIRVRPDLVRLSEVELTTEDVGLMVRASGDGAIVDEYALGGDTVDLKIISTDAVEGRSIEGLGDVPIATPTGDIVTLEQIADIRWVGAPPQIARVGRLRSVSFQITPPDDTPLEMAVAEIEQIIQARRDHETLPPTISTSIVGTASKLRAVSEALLGDGTVIGTIGSSFALAIIVVYLLMAALFQSFVRPLVILFSVPLATLGGFAALAAVHTWSQIDPYLPVQKLDVLTMLGFVLLIGIVVNNAILIVHQTINFMTGTGEIEVDGSAVHEVMTSRRAIAEAVRTRVRPIFMSTLTSIGGMLPLVLMPGSGSELYRGLGSVVVGGLLVSTIFTLLLVPTLLSVTMDIAAWFGPREPEVSAATA